MKKAAALLIFSILGCGLDRAEACSPESTEAASLEDKCRGKIFKMCSASHYKFASVETRAAAEKAKDYFSEIRPKLSDNFKRLDIDGSVSETAITNAATWATFLVYAYNGRGEETLANVLFEEAVSRAAIWTATFATGEATEEDENFSTDPLAPESFGFFRVQAAERMIGVAKILSENPTEEPAWIEMERRLETEGRLEQALLAQAQEENFEDLMRSAAAMRAVRESLELGELGIPEGSAIVVQSVFAFLTPVRAATPRINVRVEHNFHFPARRIRRMQTAIAGTAWTVACDFIEEHPLRNRRALVRRTSQALRDFIANDIIAIWRAPRPRVLVDLKEGAIGIELWPAALENTDGRMKVEFVRRGRRRAQSGRHVFRSLFSDFFSNAGESVVITEI
ncbi:MAG: hypothetical protein LBL99_03260 [Holosporaceae bacterium]|jgi:hypothetical protein|nr:hypothetical protein [Holosporaceae bacterium]